MSAIRFSADIGPDGVIRPPKGVNLPVGNAEIIVLSEPAAAAGQPPVPKDHLFDRLARLAQELGIDPNEFPEDLAENHDHYAHGAPKGLDRL